MRGLCNRSSGNVEGGEARRRVGAEAVRTAQGTQVQEEEVSWFTWFWIAWILAFVVVEVIALRRKAPGDTLSEQVWAVLRGRPVLWFLGAGFLVWLLLHFLLPTFSGV